jgi:hypothetical protein
MKPFYQIEHSENENEPDTLMPIEEAAFRNEFHWQASLLWARGLPPPTADEIADAMVKALDFPLANLRSIG